MTKTEFLRKLLELGNRAGAYSVGEARSGSEIIDSIESNLRQLDKLLDEKDPKSDSKENKESSVPIPTAVAT